MAKIQSIAKPAAKPDRSEIAFQLCGQNISQIADHLQDLSNLLYENQDRFKNDPFILGALNLLEGYANDLQEAAKRLQG